MNKKRVWGALGVVVLIIFISCSTMHKKSSASVTQSGQWLKQYPQLGSVESKFSNSSNPTNKIVASPQKTSPFGVITNPFGIKDDVLAYILKKIPSSNESAIYAAIKIAAYDKAVMLSDNRKDALVLEKQQGVAIRCLDKALGMKDSDKISEEISKLDTSTPELKALNRRSEELLAWQIISPDLSDDELIKACSAWGY